MNAPAVIAEASFLVDWNNPFLLQDTESFSAFPELNRTCAVSGPLGTFKTLEIGQVRVEG